MKFTPEVIAALQTLKDNAENDFELHRISVLEKDLTNPPVVEIVDDTHQKFNGVTFHNDGKKHYRVNIPLHRAVYSYYLGDIPIGYDIHHIDENKSNNDVSNLQLLSKREHVAIHHRGICYAKTSEKFCVVCGKSITKRNNGRNKFCSSECAAKFNYQQSLESRSCVICGNTFVCDKHSKTQTCSPTCSLKIRFLNYTPVPKTEKRLCVICGKEFESIKSKPTCTCSKSCATKLSWINGRQHYSNIAAK